MFHLLETLSTESDEEDLTGGWQLSGNRNGDVSEKRLALTLSAPNSVLTV